MSDDPNQERDQRHKQRMQRKKAVVDAKVAEATIERGIFVLVTGNGKGKSSSGFGTVIRCVGHGYRAGVVQFIKGKWQTGEELFLRRQCPDLPFYSMATGFTWDTQDRSADIAAAEETWLHAEQLLSDPTLHLVLLDELTYMLKYQYLDEKRILNALSNRPREQSVVITGRGAPASLHALADTVSVIGDEKHAFRAGIKARKGVEW